MKKKIEKSIQKIKSILEIDGGDIEVVDFDKNKNIIKIKLLGVCQHCPMAELTITGFIQEELRKVIPKVKVERI
ncbi:MAG: NifU family protein [Patescibacteria group bacterium]|nr:NifU family protein [Patescibacteria group bacterium]